MPEKILDGNLHCTNPYKKPNSNYEAKEHTGIDFAANTGDKVYSPYDGEVVAVGSVESYGNRVIIKSVVMMREMYFLFAHLSVISVAEGAKVKAGSKIGEVGSTGISSGSHLHFEARTENDYWKYTDPTPHVGGNIIGEAIYGSGGNIPNVITDGGLNINVAELTSIIKKKQREDSRITEDTKGETVILTPLIGYYDNSLVSLNEGMENNDFPRIRDSMELPGFLQIGDVEFIVPPQSISVQKSMKNSSTHTMRTRTSHKIKTGHNDTIIDIVLYFHSLESINGYKTEGLDGTDWYINGLRPLIAQFKRTPFLPIKNYDLNYIHEITDVTLKNITAQTLPGFPEAIVVNITLLKFDIQPFLSFTPSYYDAVNWPLLRWYTQQPMSEKNRNDDKLTYLKEYRHQEDNSLKFEIISEDYLVKIQQKLGNFNDKLRPSEFIAEKKAKGTRTGEIARDAEELQLGIRQKERYLANKAAGDTKSKYIMDNEKSVYLHGLLKGTSTTNCYALSPSSPEVIDILEENVHKNPNKDSLNFYGNYVKTYFGLGPEVYYVPLDSPVIEKILDLHKRNNTNLWDQYEKEYLDEKAAIEGDLSNVRFEKIEIEDLYIQSMMIAIDNVISSFQIQQVESPSHQFLGGGEVFIELNIQTKNEAALIALANDVVKDSERLARTYRTGITSGFLSIQNDFIQLFGVKYVMVNSLNVDTVPGYPGLYDINMVLVGFDKNQRDSEKLRLINNAENIKSMNDLRKTGELQDFIVEQQLLEMELYPDLELPTFAELKQFCEDAKCKYPYSLLEERICPITGLVAPLGSYVDPDFYVHTPSTFKNIVQQEIEKQIERAKQGEACMQLQDPYTDEANMVKITIPVEDSEVEWYPFQISESLGRKYQEIEADVKGIHNAIQGEITEKKSSSGQSYGRSSGTIRDDEVYAAVKNMMFYFGDIPDWLWFPIMMGESTGDPNASAGGGHGLFQIQTEGLDLEQRKNDWGFSTIEELYNPTINARIAAEHVLFPSYKEITDQIGAREGTLDLNDLEVRKEIAVYVWQNGVRPKWTDQLKIKIEKYVEEFSTKGTVDGVRPGSITTPISNNEYDQRDLDKIGYKIENLEDGWDKSKHGGSNVLYQTIETVSGIQYETPIGDTTDEWQFKDINDMIPFRDWEFQWDLNWGDTMEAKIKNVCAQTKEYRDGDILVSKEKIEYVGLWALRLFHYYGNIILPSIVIAQAIYESGCQGIHGYPFGSDVLINSHNYFGIEPQTSWDVSYVQVSPNIGPRYIAFDSEEEGFKGYVYMLAGDWGKNLIGSGSQFALVKKGNIEAYDTNYKNYANKLEKYGWKSFPTGYASELIHIIETLNLAEWDKLTNRESGFIREDIKDIISDITLSSLGRANAYKIRSVGYDQAIENRQNLGIANLSSKEAMLAKMWKDSFYDMLESDQRGRLVRAFPTFHMMLIDEGHWYSWVKMWDNFYGFNAIESIDVVKSRKIAADTCLISMSNIYRNLTDMDINADRLNQYSKNYKWWDILIKNFDKTSLIEARKERQETLMLQTGARLHLRMGYGSNALNLPVMFNGTITELEFEEDTINLVAQGDGIELCNALSHKKDATNDDNHMGQEARATLVYALSSYNNIFRQFIDMQMNDPNGVGWLAELALQKPANPNGVAHFGNPLHPPNNIKIKFWWQDPSDKHTEEVGMNIYTSTGLGVRSEWIFQEGDVGNKLERESLGYRKAWGIFRWPAGDEVNVKLSLYNKSIWDIANTLTLIAPDYVTAVLPYEFRSTLFYGKPYWPYFYRSVYKYNWSSVNKYWEKNAIQEVPLSKSMSQSHIYMSYTDIILNKIKASEEGVKTNVIATFNEAKASNAMCADTDIYPEKQKTAVVNIDMKAPNKNIQDSVAAQLLRNFIKDMYKGNLIVIGDPSVKPHDLIYINDVSNQMFGGAGVKQVVHRMNMNSGFTTDICPDAIVIVDDSVYMSLVSVLTSILIGTAATGMGAIVALASWRKIMLGVEKLKALTSGVLDPILASMGLDAATVGAAGDTWTLAELEKMYKNKGRESKVLNALIKANKTKAVTKTRAVLRAVKGLLTRVWVVGIIADVGLSILAHNALEAYSRFKKSRQAVMVFPLTYKGKPWTAGLNGHQGCVIGDDPSRIDKFWDGESGYVTDGVINMLNSWIGE